MWWQVTDPCSGAFYNDFLLNNEVHVKIAKRNEVCYKKIESKENSENANHSGLSGCCVCFEQPP